uniref:Sorting nexin-33 n=1 Tax=Aceria tosichella TaxID=561515 RepID=A0A6G1SCP8_9ACAR
MKARVLFDFPAQPDTSELNIREGEILTVLSKDVGEGWWEGTNDRGERGLFPASYVEEIAERPPIPPAPINHSSSASIYQNTTGLVSQQQQQSSSSGGSFFTPTQTSQFKSPEQDGSAATTQQQHTEEPDWPDEEWDDDDDDSGDNATDFQGSQRGYPAGNRYYGAADQTQAARTSFHSGADMAPAVANLSLADNRQQSSNAIAKPRKNLNRFSNFVKSGLEGYILEPKTMPRSSATFIIQYDPELGIIWKPNFNPYTCAVTKHGKETKMKGLKTYISYDITPSTSNIIVRRRYKHFDWLLQRLEEKFIVTPLPPLPEKQIAGRFQEDFVEHRRNLLQLWVNYITRHPILSQCDVWWHFMTCSTDDLKGWKLGKRKAEKDEFVGANFFFSVDVNPATTPLDPVKTTKQLDNFQRFVSKFDDAVKHMFTTAVDQSKKFSNVYAKDYKKLSESIKELSSAFQSGTAWRNSLGLNEAIRQTSGAYEEIARLHEEEPKYDFEPMADILHQYRGLLSGWPEILQLHKNTVNLRTEHERLLEEGKINDSEMVRVNQRSNVVTYATLAEINHFHNERLMDFKQMMQVFLTAQINFHSDIVSKLTNSLNKINSA